LDAFAPVQRPCRFAALDESWVSGRRTAPAASLAIDDSPTVVHDVQNAAPIDSVPRRVDHVRGR
jgi:hypothetical protein